MKGIIIAAVVIIVLVLALVYLVIDIKLDELNLEIYDLKERIQNIEVREIENYNILNAKLNMIADAMCIDVREANRINEEVKIIGKP